VEFVAQFVAQFVALGALVVGQLHVEVSVLRAVVEHGLAPAIVVGANSSRGAGFSEFLVAQNLHSQNRPEKVDILLVVANLEDML
jgi:hypothetical protein